MQSEADNQEQQPLIVLPGGVGVYTSSVAEELRIDFEARYRTKGKGEGEGEGKIDFCFSFFNKN